MLKYQLIFCIGKDQCQISYSTMTLVTLLVKLLGKKKKEEVNTVYFSCYLFVYLKNKYN